MTEIASLSLEVRSDQVKQATASLREMVPAASAAERAAQKWGMATSAAGRSSEDFSKRVNNVIRSLEFERQQLTRNSAEKAKYEALKRAGVSATSAEGQAIAASVAALQAQKARTEGANEAQAMLTSSVVKLAAAFGVAAIAAKAWQAGMKAGDLAEQAEQVNLTTDQLQAYRFVAVQNGVEVEKLDQSMIRFTATLGAAGRGGEEQIKIFERLGIKILDARGELRQTGDILPELSRGLLELSSNTERNSILTELFGKSGARMVTMLQDWAKGNDALVDSAKRQGAVLDAEAIAKWDALSDALKRAGLASEVTWAKLGAPIATFALENVVKLLDAIVKSAKYLESLDARNAAFRSHVEIENMQKRLADNEARIAAHPGAKGIDKLKAENDELRKKLEAALPRQAAAQVEVARAQVALNGGIDPTDPNSMATSFRKLPKTEGTSNPTPKGQADAWQRLLDFGQDFIDKQKAQQAALGQSAEAASRLTHEQELLAKATEAGRSVSASQAATIKELAGKMAEAETSFKTAKFMDDFRKNSEQFIAQQEIERATLYMSTEAAMAYRIEQEAINKAKADGLTLTPAMTAQIQELAAAQAAAAEKTRRAREWVEFEKETFKSFFTDINRGLREGADVWEAFGNAALNVLNKISDKLLSMAADQLFNAAFGGSGGIAGGLGGLFGGLFGGVSNIAPGTGGMTFADALAGGLIPVAKGGIFNQGNVVPFARGGIVSSPTLFPMKTGAGLMGEAGPEGILPLRRGRGGRLGVEASGMGGGSSKTVHVTIEQTVQVGSIVSRAEHEADMRRLKRETVDAAKTSLLEDVQSGGSTRRIIRG